MAAASYVTELVQGMTMDEVESLTFETLMDDLGREVVMARPTCATVALGTLKQGLHELHMRRKAAASECFKYVEAGDRGSRYCVEPLRVSTV